MQVEPLLKNNKYTNPTELMSYLLKNDKTFHTDKSQENQHYSFSLHPNILIRFLIFTLKQFYP